MLLSAAALHSCNTAGYSSSWFTYLSWFHDKSLPSGKNYRKQKPVFIYMYTEDNFSIEHTFKNFQIDSLKKPQ